MSFYQPAFGEDSACRGAPHTYCQTEILRLVKAPELMGGSGRIEQWQPCRGFASCNDILCPTHRRIVNETAKSGSYMRNTQIRVHPDAVKHYSCQFSALILKCAENVDGTTLRDYQAQNSTLLMPIDVIGCMLDAVRAAMVTVDYLPPGPPPKAEVKPEVKPESP